MRTYIVYKTGHDLFVNYQLTVIYHKCVSLYILQQKCVTFRNVLKKSILFFGVICSHVMQPISQITISHGVV
jgi:hypothetical protein